VTLAAIVELDTLHWVAVRGDLVADSRSHAQWGPPERRLQTARLRAVWRVGAV